jgi:hypothetical protein
MELSSGINTVIPDYATLRVLADEKDTVVANNVRIAPDGEGLPNFMVLYKKRYIARGEAAGADYRVVHVLEWVIMRSDPKYFEDVPTARYVMTLGETAYANPSAPFVAYRKISEEETENDYVKTYGDPEHVLHAIRQNLEDVAGGQPYEIRDVLDVYAYGEALRLRDFYAAQANTLSPLDYTWDHGWHGNYGASADQIAIVAQHRRTFAADRSATHHTITVTVKGFWDKTWNALHSESYVIATVAMPDDGSGTRVKHVEGPALDLMNSNRFVFRGLYTEHLYAMQRPLQFKGDDVKDWDQVERFLVAPFLWTAFLRLKLMEGDTDVHTLSERLSNVSVPPDFDILPSTIAPAITQSFHAYLRRDVTADVPANARFVREIAFSGFVVEPAFVPVIGGDAPLFEVETLDVRYAGVPIHSGRGDLQFRPAKTKRTAMVISAVVRVRDVEAFKRLESTDRIFELFAVAPTNEQRKKDRNIEKSPHENRVVAFVSFWQLRVNTIYRDIVVQEGQTQREDFVNMERFVVAFIIPIQRIAPLQRAESDAKATVKVVQAAAALSEFFWLDALLARVEAPVRATVAAIEKQTYQGSSDMPRLDPLFTLTDAARYALRVPYAAIFVTGATSPSFRAALAPGKEDKNVAKAIKRIVDTAAGSPDVAFVSIQGHAHAVRTEIPLRDWSQRWYNEIARGKLPPERNYYSGATVHIKNEYNIPFDDQRIEPELNTRLAQCIFKHQHSLDMRVRTRNGQFVACHVDETLAHLINTPLYYSECDIVLQDLNH